MSLYEIDVAACRGRQQRLVAEMQRQEVDLVIVTQFEHVQWLAGPKFGWAFQPAAALSADGQLTLIAPNEAPETAAADQVVTYEAQWHATLRNDQRQASSEALIKALGRTNVPRRIGVEFSTFPPHLAGPLDAELVDIEPRLYWLRRRKDADELALMKKAIAATGKMYERARQIIRPGINELTVFNELQTAAINELRERHTGTGNDYQCGSRGGPPRDRPARDGQLYILDLSAAFRGYFSDNARTIAVNGRPTEEQHEAWQYIMEVFAHVEQAVKPGKNATQLYHEAKAILDEAPLGEFSHHLGHGIGLFPHEAPHLNPHWDDTFQASEVFTCEPGLYAPELAMGMRIENNYLVTEDGLELLTDFPLEL